VNKHFVLVSSMPPDQCERGSAVYVHATICSAKLGKAKDESVVFTDALTGVCSRGLDGYCEQSVQKLWLNCGYDTAGIRIAQPAPPAASCGRIRFIKSE
jgi:hypothetical protein